MSFQFKQFAIADDRCAMKVNTDGVLLGAWASMEGCTRALDIGTGSGVIALMMAQRTPAQTEVVGIDIDEASIAQAQKNAEASPFASRVCMQKADIRRFEAEPFSHIVCNPPFHTETLTSPKDRRAQARHAHALTLKELIHHAVRLLAPEGHFAMIAPCAAKSIVLSAAVETGLQLTRLTTVHTKAGKAPKRLLIEWTKQAHASKEGLKEAETLFLTNSDGSRTAEYAALTREFYLNT